MTEVRGPDISHSLVEPAVRLGRAAALPAICPRLVLAASVLSLAIGVGACARARMQPTGMGGSSNSGGAFASGGSADSGGAEASGGSSTGGTTKALLPSGGSSTGGSSSGGSSSGGAGDSGGTSSSGGAPGSGGSIPADAAADAPVDVGPPAITYALGPPNQMINQFFIPGCQTGSATSPGGGNCVQGQNACEGTKQGARINFLCPRFMLFSDEMAQAALDDGYAGLNYAVVGHDSDTGGIDGNVNISCCQCYQLVFSLPENVAQVGGSGASAIPIPPPLVVQSFNTSAGGGKNFDVFMGAGGFGAFNACDPNASMKSNSGKYLYTQFPQDGEPGSGGVNAATQIAGCKGTNNQATTATLSSATCQSNVAAACGKFQSGSTTVTSESIHSCTQSNNPNSYYHINWQIYAKRVECPTHLTQVTGCKLAPQNLPAVNPAVTTPAQAAADSSFKSGYTITTMQDCCMPTCAWQNNTKGMGLSMVGNYDSFYSCDQNGVPATDSSTADAGK
jgi:hypothetical protein